jgi:hypothetical protein
MAGEQASFHAAHLHSVMCIWTAAADLFFGFLQLLGLVLVLDAEIKTHLLCCPIAQPWYVNDGHHLPKPGQPSRVMHTIIDTLVSNLCSLQLTCQAA